MIAMRRWTTSKFVTKFRAQGRANETTPTGRARTDGHKPRCSAAIRSRRSAPACFCCCTRIAAMTTRAAAARSASLRHTAAACAVEYPASSMHSPAVRAPTNGRADGLRLRRMFGRVRTFNACSHPRQAPVPTPLCSASARIGAARPVSAHRRASSMRCASLTESPPLSSSSNGMTLSTCAAAMCSSARLDIGGSCDRVPTATSASTWRAPSAGRPATSNSSETTDSAGGAATQAAWRCSAASASCPVVVPAHRARATPGWADAPPAAP